MLCTTAIAIPICDYDIYLGSTNQLLSKGSSPKNEVEWLDSILTSVSLAGAGFTDPAIQDTEILAALGMDKDQELYQINGWNPGFSWTYAIVKFDNTWAAFQDNGDGLLCIPNPLDIVFGNAISHVTFVPEPATMLLLGFGLIGLTVFGRKRFLKGA